MKGKISLLRKAFWCVSFTKIGSLHECAISTGQGQGANSASPRCPSALLICSAPGAFEVTLGRLCIVVSVNMLYNIPVFKTPMMPRRMAKINALLERWMSPECVAFPSLGNTSISPVLLRSHAGPLVDLSSRLAHQSRVCVRVQRLHCLIPPS